MIGVIGVLAYRSFLQLSFFAARQVDLGGYLAFDFDPKAYAKWKEEQQYLLLRPRHSDEPTELAGGADLDEDVEASLQHVIAQRARQAQEIDTSRLPSGSTTFDLNSLLCCAARKVA